VGLTIEKPDAGSIGGILKEAAPRVLQRVYRRFGDFTAAEDAAQEALLAAAQQWPREGLPKEPVAWLTRVAVRRSVDAIRSETAARRRERQSFQDTEDLVHRDNEQHEDETLLLLFLCCHPALSTSSSIVLTLRAVAGLTTSEIARAYFVSETTMAQRIRRAKETIRSSGLRFEQPDPKSRARRLGPVLRVLYLMFNEGYLATAGPNLTRDDLAAEAMRLTRLLAAELPREPEVSGLLALMLLTQARRASRTDAGELVPIDRQNRSLWNREQIAEGSQLVTEALGRGAPGRYQIEAAIAALHDEAASFDVTDWPQILALYEFLWEKTADPMAQLNRVVALAMVRGAAEGLRALDAVATDSRIAGSYRADAIRAHLLRLAGNRQAAIHWFRTAARKTISLPERNFLILQAAELSQSPDVEN